MFQKMVWHRIFSKFERSLIKILIIVSEGLVLVHLHIMKTQYENSENIYPIKQRIFAVN
jgi:hypothetical protein